MNGRNRAVAHFLLILGLTLNFVLSDNLFEDVRLRYYYGRTDAPYIEFTLNEGAKLVKYPSFRRNQSTILYIHGWNEKIDESPTLSEIVNSYLHRRNHNIVILKYEKLAGVFYTISVANHIELGKRVAATLIDAFNNGLDPSKIHLIGYSLGAHIGGAIGRTLQPAFILPRITGLDPAYPMFYETGPYLALNLKDAEFVDIIHTDSGIIGGPSSGHADFFPNGGKRPQPRCKKPIKQPTFFQFLWLAVDHCAHAMSVHYYAQSVREEAMFLATSRSNSSQTTHMGYNCPNTARGDYDLITE